MAFWTNEEVASLTAMMASGQTVAGISAAMNRPYDSVRAKIKKMRIDNPAPQIEIPAEEFEAMAASAGVVRQPQAPTVTSAWLDDEDPAAEWARHERINDKAIHKSKTKDKFEVKFDADEPIAVAFVSDQHISPGTPVDMARMRADAEFIRDTPNLYAVLCGDGIDNHIKHRGAMLAMRSTASDQYKLFEFYLSIFAPKVLALCSGNHESFTKAFAGIDVLDYISERQRICYSPHGFVITVIVGGQPYVIHCRHQYRMNSSVNETHAPKQLWRFGEVDFDIGNVAHNHVIAVESAWMRGLKRIFMRSGTYQISSDYAKMYGYNSCYETCPTAILFPRKRKLIGFDDMRDAVQHLRGYLR